MKKQAPLVLSIPEPCTQSWEEMSIAGSGRFCSHCQHTVTDISGMSDATVYQLLQQGHLRCIRALSSQLNRNITFPSQKPTHLYRVAIALGLTIMMAGGPETYARPKAPLTEQNLLSCTNDSTLKSRSDKDSVTLRGIVVDETGQPFGGVVVKLIQEGLLKGGAITEDDGTFSIIAQKEDYELEFRAASYKTQRLFLNKNSTDENVPI
ncbi:MAG TPA: carboxypeptidase-like regulatory domain-containing protein [Chitinophagaceae bacterium]|nr:carboxypeptidase-like regulatory domain-containing protein [Chitinophagaceae bacterium]